MINLDPHTKERRVPLADIEPAPSMLPGCFFRQLSVKIIIPEEDTIS